MSQSIILILGLYFALTFLMSGLSKLESPDYSLVSLIKIYPIPNGLAEMSFSFLSWMEIIVSVLLIIDAQGRFGALLTVILFVGFTAIQVVFMSKGKSASCGCYGTLYQVKTNHLHLVATLLQLLVALLYYWLVSYEGQIPTPYLAIRGITYVGLCLFILARRFMQRNKEE